MRIGTKILPQNRLAMTFALGKALELLQMPQWELALWLQNEVEKNPLLELDREAFVAQKSDFPVIQAPISLYEHLVNQIRERFSNISEREEALRLMECLDEKGFIQEAPENHPLVPILQQFDPPGIFARDLRECLLLQLSPQTLAHTLVNHHFQDLLHGRFKKIKQQMRGETLDCALKTLSRLNLRPAALFRQEPSIPIKADLIIIQTDTELSVRLYDEDLPQFHLRSFCKDALSNEEKILMQTWKASGSWLLRSLQKRKELLLQVGEILIRKQKAYLQQEAPLAPCTLRTLAKELHIHESTLSRALAHKYAETPLGFISLKSLIPPAPDMTAAKRAIAKLVTQENKNNPLSDLEIAKHLCKTNIQLARRTVAKYRKQLRIGSHSLRKHLKP